jgi:glycosyltransferase involved in cell wall biosynthesis
MSVYNGADHVRQAIDSILAQSLPDFEFIIVDDASTDSTLEVIHSYRDPRIILLENESNVGLAESLNRGLAAAHGGYVARQDADDSSHPDRLFRQARYLDRHPKVGVVGSAARWVDDEQNTLQIWPSGMDNPELQQRFIETCWLIHGSTMSRRQCFEQADGYDATMRTGQDYDLWLRVSEIWDLASLPDVLYTFRRHQDASSVSHKEEQMRNAQVGRARAIQRRLSYGWGRLGVARTELPSSS